MYAKSYTDTPTTVTGAAAAANDNFKKGNAIRFERDGSEGDVPVIAKVTKLAETFAVTGIYKESSTKTDLTVTSTGVEGNDILKMDEDTEVIYVNTDKKAGVSGGELQTATEAAIDDTYIKNIIAYTDVSGFATGETAKVIFVDVANKLDGEYALADSVTPATGTHITNVAAASFTITGTGTQAANEAAAWSGAMAAQVTHNGVVVTSGTVAVGDVLTVVAEDGTTSNYTVKAIA